jgi:hypothetical protein
MSATNQNTVDIDALLDLTEYDAPSNYESPSLSPAGSSKQNFASPISAAVPTPSISSTSSQTLSGPSHNYELYRQQTGFVPGALTNTMAVNQTNNTGYQEFAGLDYLSAFSPETEMFDFNTSPTQHTMGASDMDMDFGSPDTQLFSTVNPSKIEQQASRLSSPTNVSTQSSNVGRLWPGAHSQAALAKAQAQAQQRQQQLMQQQQQQVQQQNVQPKARGKASQPSDPIVEQKITQLLNSMRAKSSSSDADSPSGNGSHARSRKEEEEMDEDERLLASEEGKKLSSKERRQLRNKVSARAFRSRRKEYISQLESEIAAKVSDNGVLRAQNRALLDENKRLSDLTRMLLSSPSFSNFLDHLSTNPTAAAPAPQLKIEPQMQPQQPQSQPEQRQLPKDVNPYNSQFSSQQQIGMAMIPEQSVDFSMLSLDNDAFNFQPQVFVVDSLEMPTAIDAEVLSGKSSNFVESFESDNEKIEVPVIERPIERSVAPEASCFDEEFEADPEFALFHSEPVVSQEEPKEIDTESFYQIDIFGGIEAEKVLNRFELVDASEEETAAALAMARVQRIAASMESVVSRLELLTMDL